MKCAYNQPLFAVAIACASAFCINAAGVVWHVDDSNCPGPGSGSIADPFCSIQDAIDAAFNGDTVSVEPGLYFEAINLNGKQISVESVGGPGPTRIVATGLGTSAITCTSGELPATEIRGFSIIGGVGTNVEVSPGVFERRGGGMYIVNTSPTVEECIFTANTAVRGGGLYAETSASILNDCEFFGNDATGGASSIDNKGGGICFNNAFIDPTRCRFENNNAHFGGGIYLIFGELEIIDCEFDSNTGLKGGGLYAQNMDPRLTRCTFVDNNANGTSSVTGVGAGMAFEFGADPTAIDCTFRGNDAERTGGAVYAVSSDGVYQACAFFDNSANDGSGGGMWLSGGTDTNILNCIYGNNTATFRAGGVGTSTNGFATITNCTFYLNDAGLEGGAMFFVESACNVRNSIAWANFPDQIATLGSPTITYSNVQGGYAGTGNIDADPMFVSAASEDFDLQSGSPCIDAGSNPAVVGVTEDFDDDPRKVDDPATADTGIGGAPLIDIGAQEYQPALCAADLTNSSGGGPDGMVNVFDLFVLLSNWNINGPGAALAEPTNIVDVFDLFVLLGAWGQCP